ncbi:Eukaryotic rRNA processing [Lasallia pustulata]|uniref:Eukaryotic rRNA processing n=1 Tax=Lasallia pustulata TaxID=136370 RepID=A0A1W5D5D7_9LECA|nr:Eukaryotic rRNA processing [Lasallia pustulata]
MAKKSKLLAALDAQKGRDFKKEHHKKMQKQAERRKKTKPVLDGASEDESEAASGAQVDGTSAQLDAESEGWETDESEAALTAVDTSRLDDSESDNEESLEDGPEIAESGSELGEGDGDEERDIPFSDLEDLPDEERDDVVPHQRLTVNNTTALLKAHKSIAFSSQLPFSEHQSIISTEPVSIADVNDDLTRELAFYKQSLDAVREARALLKKESVPFSRPTDYFAEMVKSDEHMGKIKQKMTDEAANKKAAAEARKQRDLKKFGKQVQIAKLQERDKAKRETLDKINILKRKRRDADTGNAQEEDLFDVALEDASKSDKPGRSDRRGTGGRTQGKRQKRDEKFGFGGKKRFSKSGDAVSSGDLRGFSSKKMKGQRAKGGPQRLGKSRRAKQ